MNACAWVLIFWMAANPVAEVLPIPCPYVPLRKDKPEPTPPLRKDKCK